MLRRSITTGTGSAKHMLALSRFQRRSMAVTIPGDSAALDKIKNMDEKKIYYFTASWCPPCKKIAPVFAKLSDEHPSLKFVKIDVDEFGSMAQEYGIRSVPTFFFVKGDDVLSAFSGASGRHSYPPRNFPLFFQLTPPPCPCKHFIASHLIPHNSDHCTFTHPLSPHFPTLLD